MPNLLFFNIRLNETNLDSVIPLIAIPKVTTLEIHSLGGWSDDTYSMMKKHYKLHQLNLALFPVHITEMLKDMPMIRILCLKSEAILDDELQEDFTSGRLGRCLTELYFCSRNGAKEWLDMINARQKNALSIVQSATNWREVFTGLKEVGIWHEHGILRIP